ncbi:PilZ domain-containing protein [Halomonas sp. LC1]|uniref:flagellar brake protein n=1 Tax=Halomonas sp. LC1 TaxID=3043733 RepID=UPI002554080D|nr:PilZ domain-containing protein [Halomonas sp. LC1]MDK9686204.1 PilZ domain-containing protein [Halomonas sp. LC1]
MPQKIVGKNVTATVIRSLLQHTHQVSIVSFDHKFPLKADVIELDINTGQLTLEANTSDRDVTSYIQDGLISLDIESTKHLLNSDKETFSLANISAKLTKLDLSLYKIDCQLPESIFIKEKRGTIRIPFILGMYARANIEVYPNELNISGRVRNFSVGGCMLDIPLSDTNAITVGKELSGLTIEFPSGESFHAEGKIKHIRPLGYFGYAALGIQFINLSRPQLELLFRFTTEAEREAAYQTGMSDAMATHSSLFIPGAKEKNILLKESNERKKKAQRTAMERGVIELAHQLQAGLMYLKTQNVFPAEIFYNCVDTIRYSIEENRKAFLLALSLLREEVEWVRHSIQATSYLADMLLIRDPHSPYIRETLLGALMHNLGKPLLVGPKIPTLKSNMTPAQKAILADHRSALLNKINNIEWNPSEICSTIIKKSDKSNKNHKETDIEVKIYEFIDIFLVVKEVNKLMHSRNGTPPLPPISAYRKVHEEGKQLNKSLLVEYIQIYGLYPIGSLAKYSGGYLAWIKDIDKKGIPNKVKVVKNLKFPDATFNSDLNEKDLSQIGKLEEIVTPSDFGIKAPRL